jgi:hypothetical protein
MILAGPVSDAAGAAPKFGSYEGFPDDLRPTGVPARVKGNLGTGNRVPGSSGLLQQVYLWRDQDANKKDLSADVRISVYRDVANNRLYGHQYEAFQQIQSLAMTVLYDGYYKGAPRTSATSRITLIQTNVKEKEIGIKPNGVQKQRWPQKLVEGNYHVMEWKSSPTNPQWSQRETHHFVVHAGNVFIHAETTYPAGAAPLVSPRILVKDIVEKLPRTGDLPTELAE